MGIYKTLSEAIFAVIFILITISSQRRTDQLSKGNSAPITAPPSIDTHRTPHTVNTLLVIPGGGTSGPDGYPAWTRDRTEAAFSYYQGLLAQQQTELSTVAFLALSAGSLNVPSGRQEDERLVFECSAVMQHLSSMGIPASQVFGDIFSWDTVTNGLTLRMYAEALLDFDPQKNSPQSATSQNLIIIHVFISDFHAARTKASFEWILGVEPPLTSHVKLIMHSLPSSGFNASEVEERAKHEAKGLQVIAKNREEVRTMAELYRFLLLGGHRGFDRYLRGNYAASTTVGYQ
mmetsp:Transcript_6969/g.13318  ORF Transcript_6969/g.13318 Transcript_6969/m.13318 type:complete len:290 (+) Transcript_6969:67-936(+)